MWTGITEEEEIKIERLKYKFSSLYLDENKNLDRKIFIRLLLREFRYFLILYIKFWKKMYFNFTLEDIAKDADEPVADEDLSNYIRSLNFYSWDDCGITEFIDGSTEEEFLEYWRSIKGQNEEREVIFSLDMWFSRNFTDMLYQLKLSYAREAVLERNINERKNASCRDVFNDDSELIYYEGSFLRSYILEDHDWKGKSDSDKFKYIVEHCKFLLVLFSLVHDILIMNPMIKDERLSPWHKETLKAAEDIFNHFNNFIMRITEQNGNEIKIDIEDIA